MAEWYCIDVDRIRFNFQNWKLCRLVFTMNYCQHRTKRWIVKIVLACCRIPSSCQASPVTRLIMCDLPPICDWCTLTLRVHCRLSSWHMEIWIISNFQCCQNSSNILSWQYIWVAISYKVPSIQKKHIHTHGVTHRQLWKFNNYEL